MVGRGSFTVIENKNHVRIFRHSVNECTLNFYQVFEKSLHFLTIWKGSLNNSALELTLISEKSFQST